MSKDFKAVYLVKVIKTDYHYMYVKANSIDEAEDYVIEYQLDDEILDFYWDDTEYEVIALEDVKTDLEGVKTIN